MLRIKHKTDAQAVKDYMRQSDYYLETPGDWMGKGASRLGLTGSARQEDFDALCDNLRLDGTPLTALTVEGRRIGYDFNFNSSKSVGLAREIIGHYDPAAVCRCFGAGTDRYVLGVEGARPIAESGDLF
jgi:hypothetical protein